MSKAEPIVKWRTGGWGDPIERIEVVRETERSVFFDVGYGVRRQEKFSRYSQFHDSWAKAHAYLLKDAEEKARSYEAQLRYAEQKLAEVKAMRPPQES